MDPMFRDVTHLVIDEVHERNADMDLLLALAKQAVKRRANHETLPPLRLVLMSATLDSTLWESYFDGNVAIVDAPETRRFPIDMVHLD
jgi:HrpA-like RNA helicase